MGQALYRKYRPRAFSEVIGQEPITDTLSKAIASGRISHAYLLSGPRGLGKTSVARILAHEVNKLLYTDEAIHLDIIEIDAASNRRIDEIRDIREKVHIAPTSAKYKVYIIDEAHMMTKEAFNALLKTLEEPPAHCIFILATTEAHKLPQTIVSRTQRYNFKPVDKNKTTTHLKNIAKKEKIGIEPAALELLAEHGDGSFRDSIGMLDQLSGNGRLITEQDVRQLLGLPPGNLVDQLLQAIHTGDTKSALNLLDQLRAEGSSPALVATQLGKNLRESMLGKDSEDYNWAVQFTKNLLDTSAAKQPYQLLEIAILEATMQNVQHKNTGKTNSVSDVVAEDSAQEGSFPPLPQNPTEFRAKIKLSQDFNINSWPEVLTHIKRRAPALYTALRLAEPKLNDRILVLNFQFALHKNKVNESRHIRLISDVIEELFGSKVEIRCSVTKKEIGSKTRESSKPAPIIVKPSEELTTISNIFGSAEVLES